MYEETDASRAEMVSSLRLRVLALRESYGLIAASHAEGVDLAELLRTVFAAVLGAHPMVSVTMDGPAVRLSSRQANAVAMIVQELLTNAAKHGVLGGRLPGVPGDAQQPAGTISLAWSVTNVTQMQVLEFHWREGPIPAAVDAASSRTRDARGGLGLTLIEGFATGDLRGSVSYGRTNDKHTGQAAWSVDLTATLTVAGSDVPASFLTETST
ncbi:MAG: sensor histidine kinase [Phycisphaerales bacterium]